MHPEQNSFQRWRDSTRKLIGRFFTLLTRPFIDFYFNYGLSRASVMSYVLCANLIIFVYLFLAITISIEDLVESPSSVRRLLELHFFWPIPEKLLIKKAPIGFGLASGDLVNEYTYETALQEYCRKYKKDYFEKYKQNRKTVEDDLEAIPFSITLELGRSFHDAFKIFYEHRRNFTLTLSFFAILAIAYIALLLNIKTNLAESVSPLIWGNLPLAHRSSEIMKILWRIPRFEVIKSRLYLFFMLPLLVAVALSVLFTCHKILDRFIIAYSLLNTTLTAVVSLIITAVLFTILYELHVAGISKWNAAIGAFVASALWLGGRWFFTTYGAVSLYRNLHNFAFVPIALTWFYYFCAVFLFGIYVAHTIEQPQLTSIARWWGMRDISIHNLYTNLAMWVRLDFLCRLAFNRNDERRPPFIGINVKGDTADEIARFSRLSSAFVRESILDMIVRHPRTFCVEIEGNRQYCRLRLPPEEVDVIPLLCDPFESEKMLDEMEEYTMGKFISQNYKHCWNAPPLMLSEVYRSYKAFAEKELRAVLQNGMHDDTAAPEHKIPST
jgi:hypothetical protein